VVAAMVQRTVLGQTPRWGVHSERDVPRYDELEFIESATRDHFVVTPHDKAVLVCVITVSNINQFG